METLLFGFLSRIVANTFADVVIRKFMSKKLVHIAWQPHYYFAVAMVMWHFITGWDVGGLGTTGTIAFFSYDILVPQIKQWLEKTKEEQEAWDAADSVNENNAAELNKMLKSL